MNVLARVRATVEAHGLLAPGGAVVVGVSGGPDSLCLLHVLRRLEGDYGLRLHVAHLDHGLRPESASDASFVAGLASQWGLPATVGHADVAALAAAENRSLEEAARVARYHFLGQVASALGAGTVAVGHNADDQVETVLMHCLRGAALAGLRGMRRKAPWPQAAAEGQPAPLLVRPLLDVPRRAIEAYCLEHGLEPRLDRTNVDVGHLRNCIRHDLISALERYNPRIRELLHRSADLLADDYDYLQQALEALWPQIVLEESGEAVVLRRSAFQQLPPSPQRSALRRAILALRQSLRDLGWQHIEQARRAALGLPAGSVVTLPAGLVLEVGYDRLIVRPAGQPLLALDSAALPEGEPTLRVPGLTPLAGGWVLRAWLAEAQPQGPPEDRKLCLDADLAGRNLRLRARRPGDRFQPLGLDGHTKSIKEYMIDSKVPRAERDRIPLLVSEWGILWIVGRRGSELARPSPGTRHFLCLELVPPAQPEVGGPA